MKYVISLFNNFLNEGVSRPKYTNSNVEVGQVFDSDDIYSYVNRIHRQDDDFYDGDLGKRIESFRRYKVVQVPIEDISIDEYQLDEDLVDEYVDMYKQNETYPPIVLGGKISGKYNIIDGTHRANALKKKGEQSIVCFVGFRKNE